MNTLKRFLNDICNFFKKGYQKTKAGILKFIAALKQKFCQLFGIKNKTQDKYLDTMKTNDKKTKEKKQSMPLFVPRTKPRLFIFNVLSTTFKFFILFIIIIGVSGIGVLVGLSKAYMDSTPELDIASIEDQNLSSFIYDSKGQLITTYTGAENREWVALDEVPQLLQKAFIAIEDIRFYSHNGIDIKRLLGSVISNFFSESVQGGSTITQQLIKISLLTPDRTYKRKIQEAYLAIQLEQTYTKDQIFEAYLNTIYLGGSNYGIKAAAKDYFNKELNELTLLECATIAGLTQNPNTYNPRLNFYSRNKPETTLNRSYKVLRNMYTAGYITKEEYEAALEDELVVEETSAAQQLYDYPHFVEYVITDVVTHLIEQRGLEDTTENRVAIEDEIRTGGYKIYTTLDPTIQTILETTVAEWDDYPSLADPDDAVYITNNADGSINEEEQPQAAAVVYDYHTGYIRGMVGRRYVPTAKKTSNLAVATWPVGSSIKPLAVYGPALDQGLLSPASIIYNIPVAIPGWDDGENGKGYPSGGLSTSAQGPITVRSALLNSRNVAAARILLDYVTIDVAAEYLLKLGIPESSISRTGSGLALGTSDISVLDMTAAFGAIANSGTYIRPVSFTQVLDSDDNIILDLRITSNRETTQAFSEKTAWLLTDMLEDAVKSGTGKNAQIGDMAVAGKTGTNSDAKGVYFVGYTPYYASGLWIGHEAYKPLAANTYASNSTAKLWQEYMSKIHESLELDYSKSIISDDPESLGLVQARVCRLSGLLASEHCDHDSNGLTPVTDWFASEYVPTETCNLHISQKICNVTNMLATSYCPSEHIEEKVITLLPDDIRTEDAEYLKTILKDIYSDLPEYVYSLTEDDPEYSTYYCSLHTKEWADNLAQYNQIVSDARSLIVSIQSNMNLISLSDDQITTINQSTLR